MMTNLTGFPITFVLILGATAHANGVAEPSISFDRAIAVVQIGIDSPEISKSTAFEAGEVLLASAGANPELVRPYRDTIVAEIERLDLRDEFDEMSGTYKLSLIKTLFPLADPSLTELFLRECQHGTFAAHGLARIGSPAIDSILRDLGKQQRVPCAARALSEMAKFQLGPKSRLCDSERGVLETRFHDVLIPRLKERLNGLRSTPGPTGSILARQVEQSLMEIMTVLEENGQSRLSEIGSHGARPLEATK